MHEMRFDTASAHAASFYKSPLARVYGYDVANDGPECETITRILAKHPLYKPGQEKHDVALWRILNRVALLLYSQAYDMLRSDMQEVVIKRAAAGFVARGQA